MYSAISSRFCCVTTTLKRQLLLRSATFVLRPFNRLDSTKSAVTMASQHFKGHEDRYNGVTIHSKEETCKPDAFTKRLEASMKEWLKTKRRTIWFRVHLSDSDWIPILVKNGFKFHHAKEEYAMLYLWLDSNQDCNIPPYAHTNLGVGAFVFNEKTEELLVVKEKNTPISMWKLPGGFVEPGENLEDAVKREVFEETGIKVTFKCLLTFRHGHGYAFGCSDIYMVAYLTPQNLEIQKCSREIAECQWMKLKEYSEHPDVHENNRTFARRMLEFLQHKMGFCVDYALHPITKRPICVYNISRVDVTS